jgi:hypothetical protein
MLPSFCFTRAQNLCALLIGSMTSIRSIDELFEGGSPNAACSASILAAQRLRHFAGTRFADGHRVGNRHDASVWILASPARPEGFSELAPTFCEKLCNGGMRIHTTWLKFWRSILRFREARQFSVKVDHSDLNWTVVACQNAARSISVMQFDEFHSEQPETGNESAGSSLILSHSFGKDVVCSARAGALH